MRKSFPIFCLLALALGLAAPRAAAQEATPTPAPTPQAKPAKWDAGLGLSAYSQEVKANDWYPVWVEIQANQAPVRGVATITQPNNPLRVEVAVEVGKGTRKVYTTYFRPLPPPQPRQPNVVTVALDAQPLGHDEIQLTLRTARQSDRHILILDEEIGAFNFLNRRAPTANTPDEPHTQAVIYSKPELIPDNPVALESLDAIIVNTPQVRRLSAAQWDAIRSWVAQGGRLLLAAGRLQPFIQESPLKNPFGTALSAPQAVPSADIFPTGPQDKNTVTSSTSILAAWPTPASGAWDRVLLGSPRRPFLAGSRVGLGWFFVCAAALDHASLEPIQNHGERPNALQNILDQPTGATPLTQARAMDERNLSQSLQRSFSIHLAGARWVLAYLLLYNLLAMPLNWWICRRLGHPHLAWPALAVIAVFFAWYGYRNGIERQQQNFQVNELTFVSNTEPGIPPKATSLITLFSPRRITGDLPAAGPIFLGRQTVSDRETPEPLTLDFSQATTLRHVVIYPWTVFNLRGDYTLPAMGGIRAAQPLTVLIRNFEVIFSTTTLTNRTPYTFRHWGLILNKQNWSAPGEFGANTSLTLTQLQRFSPPGYGSSLFEIIRTSVDTAFPLDAAQKETRPPAVMPAPETWMPQESNGYLDEAKIYFIGEVDGLASPLGKTFASQKNTGRIFYEQPLPMGSAEASALLASTVSPWAPGDWTARVIQVGNGRDNPAGDRHQVRAALGQSLAIPLNEVILEVKPEHALLKHPWPEALQITYLFQNYPNPYSIWKLLQTTIYYQMEDCPMDVFNYKWGTWEPRIRDGRGQMTLIPATDYLRPNDSAILLRLRAEPDGVIFKAQYAPNPAQRLLTGKQLFEPRFGVQNPTNYTMLERMATAGISGLDMPPLGAQISDLQITLVKTTIPQAERTLYH